jgi:hypothetical protein
MRITAGINHAAADALAAGRARQTKVWSAITCVCQTGIGDGVAELTAWAL